MSGPHRPRATSIYLHGEETPGPRIREGTDSQRRAPGSHPLLKQGGSPGEGRATGVRQQRRKGRHTAGAPRWHENSPADAERQTQPSTVSVSPALKWELTFPNAQGRGRPRCPRRLPRRPPALGDTVRHASPDPEEGEERGGHPGAPYRVGPGDLHRIGDAMGWVAGLGGPPRLRHGLRGPRHGGGRPDKLPLDGHWRLKASPRHLLAGSPVTGTCEKSREEAGSAAEPEASLPRLVPKRPRPAEDAVREGL